MWLLDFGVATATGGSEGQLPGAARMLAALPPEKQPFQPGPRPAVNPTCGVHLDPIVRFAHDRAADSVVRSPSPSAPKPDGLNDGGKA